MLLLAATAAGIGFGLLSGATRIVIAAGSSMEPGISSGDLIVVRRAASYAIGDVVAYRSEGLGTVLHRIVDTTSIDGRARFVLRGDNNGFVDSSQPELSSILGRSGVVVPNGGRLLSLLSVGVTASFAAYWVFTADDRSSKRQAVRNGTTPTRVIVGWSIAAVATGLALASTFAPASSGELRSATHDTSVTLGWSADIETSVIYPNGKIDQNGPAFLSEVDVIKLDAHAVADNEVTDADVVLDLSAIVSDGSGWSRSLDIDPRVTGESGTAQVSGILDLRALRSMLNDVAERTGFRAARHDVTIQATGTLTGNFAGEQFVQPLEHFVTMSFDDVMFAPPSDAVWEITATDAVSVEQSNAAALSAGPVEIPIATARLVAPLLMVLGLAMALWPRRSMRQADGINKHLAPLLVSAERVDLPPSTTTVTVDSVADLERLAQIEGSPILYANQGGHEWATSAFGVWYRFVLAEAEAEAAQSQVVVF